MVKGEEGTKLLSLIRPITAVIPEVEAPISVVAMESKQSWTAIVTLIYLLCCQIPLYGIVKNAESDPYSWMRTILASNRGSLMELGISPLVTASMIMQLLAGAKLIKVDQSVKAEKELFQGAQKLFGIAIAFGQAFAYTWSGSYGSLQEIGAGNAILIVVQLTGASIITILLDDLMTKGYGIGNSGTSLFIAINIAETVLWQCFSPLSFKGPKGELEIEQFEGSIVELFYGGIVGPERAARIQNVIFRTSLPNITSVLATVIVFLVVINFQGYKVNLELSSDKTTTRGNYAIKLFYTSNIPIILQTALVSNLYFFCNLIYRNFKGSFPARILGTWQQVGFNGQETPVSGLIYYIMPPNGLYQAFFGDPLKTIIYIAFVITICAVFSRTWIDVSGQGPKELSDNFKGQGMVIKGYRNQGTYNKLKQLIYTAATLGGICIGLLTIAADFLGAIGSGTGILLTVNIIYGLYEQIVKSKAKGDRQQQKSSQ